MAPGGRGHGVAVTDVVAVDSLTVDVAVIGAGVVGAAVARRAVERPRPARLIVGDRPAGVHTTAAVQQLVAAGVRPGRRAVVLDAERVSFSAVDTLAHAGCATVALVTAERAHQTYGALAWRSAGRRRVPVLCGVEVTEIMGRDRVEAVRLSDGRAARCRPTGVPTRARTSGRRWPADSTPVGGPHPRTRSPRWSSRRCAGSRRVASSTSTVVRPSTVVVVRRAAARARSVRTPVAPGRPFTAAASWLPSVRPADGPVTLTMEVR